MNCEVIEHEGIRFAEVIRATARAEKSVFYSPDGQSFQFGILAHEAGFIEPPHFHPGIERRITDLQQMFVVQFGVIEVDFFSKAQTRLATVRLNAGDAINLLHGSHCVRVIETMQCISVKQGPFLGVENDKIEIEVKE